MVLAPRPSFMWCVRMDQRERGIERVRARGGVCLCVCACLCEALDRFETVGGSHPGHCLALEETYGGAP